MISIIVPTFNEEKIIGDRLKSLLRLKGDYEIIVSDASLDGTYDVAKKYVRVIRSRKGRGVQMNSGVRFSRGSILLFLHADTYLNKDSLSKIEDVIDKGYVGGRFVLDFDSSNIMFKILSFLTKSDLFRLYYGDQGFFCRKDVFGWVKGYKNLEIMEDIDFYNRLKKEGRVKIIREPVMTSARRFLEYGIIKTLTLMSLLKVFFAFGLSDERLKKFYLEVR